jgi:excisionase family DNA binding protein
MERITLTVKDISEALGVSLITAYDLVNSQGFPAIRIGKRIIIPRDAFQRWLDNSCGNTVLETKREPSSTENG